MTGSDQFSKKAEVMFQEINQTIETLVFSLQKLIKDTESLALEATNGNLKSRVNIEQHKGEFKTIMEGLNQTLDSVVEPVNESLRVSKNYADYNFAERFDPSLNVKGDWIQFREALNNIGIQVSDAISLINTSITNLVSSVEKTSASVEEVLSGTHLIAENTGKVSHNAIQSNEGIGQVLKAMEDLNITVGAVSRKSESVSVASNDANNLAKGGIELASLSDKAMKEITGSTT
ncbi:hypothetical protein ACKUB1_11150 [Methanospirillum stamsii]|uniref:hypothetical protein n=1 Tax=Methanospirillum stamsii TaxID=1277351 RepID=UPI00390832AB